MKLNYVKLLKDFFNAYFETGKIIEIHVDFIYDWLTKFEFLKLTKEEKKKLMQDADVMLILELEVKEPLKAKLKEITALSFKQDEKVSCAKRMAVNEFLRKLNTELAKEIENKINNLQH